MTVKKASVKKEDRQKETKDQSTILADLEFFYGKIDGTLRSFQRFFQDELDLFNTKLDALEQQVATITVGYAEQAVLVESLIHQLEFEDEERQKAFGDKVTELRDMMLKTLEYTSDVMEDGNTDSEQSVENLAE